MKFWVDAQLPPLLAEWLSKNQEVFAKTFPDALALLAAGQAIVEIG